MMFYPSGAVFKSKASKQKANNMNDGDDNRSTVNNNTATDIAPISENKNEDDDNEIKKLAFELKTRQIANLILKNTLIDKVSNSQQNDSPSSNNDLATSGASNSTPILHGLLKMQDTASLYVNASSIFLKQFNNTNNDNESPSNSPSLDSPVNARELNDRILKTFNQSNNNANCEEDGNERFLSSSVSSLSSLSPYRNSSITTSNSSPKTTVATTAATRTTPTPVILSPNSNNSDYYSSVSNTLASQSEKQQEHDEYARKCLNETPSPRLDTTIMNENLDGRSNTSTSSSSGSDNLITRTAKKRKRKRLSSNQRNFIRFMFILFFLLWNF